jgi:hypothetical protein
MNGFTQVLAKENSEVLINACCPGWVSSDMGHVSAVPTPLFFYCATFSFLIMGFVLCSLSASLPSLLVSPNSAGHLFHRSPAHRVFAFTNIAEEGARVPLNIALKDIGGTTGKYWANSSVSGTGEGQVQKW